MRSSLALILVVAFATFTQAQSRSSVPRRLAENQAAQPLATEVEGTLRRNSHAKQGEAPYALVDRQGRVAYYVQQQPGVALAHHVGRRVKLSGTPAKAPGQRVPVLAAETVEPAVKGQVSQAAHRSRGRDMPVSNAAHQEALPEAMELGEGETIVEGPYYEGPDEGTVVHQGHAHAPLGGGVFDPMCDVCGGWGCDVCGRPGSLVSGLYGRVEYLHWWTEGMYTPALVTTSPPGTARADAGVLGVPGTEVLFGRTSLNNGGRSGGRINLGYWFDPGRCHSIEGDYWALGNANDSFFASSPGIPILARPFYDIDAGTESSELVAFPSVLSGSVTVSTESSLRGAGLRKRWHLAGCDPCDPCDGYGWRYDFTAGYRYMRLDDDLSVRENLTSTDPTNPGSFIVFDQFQTQNTFNGAELGTVFEGRNGRWSWEFLGRLALGSTHSRVAINGFTDITPPGGPTTRSRGGLLAQRTNIGHYEHDDFAVVPELGATVGMQLTSVWRVTLGYNFIYWSNVARAGQQIDRDINPNLLPPEASPFTGPLRPAFRFNDTDFWAMGVNVGLDARW